MKTYLILLDYAFNKVSGNKLTILIGTKILKRDGLKLNNKYFEILLTGDTFPQKVFLILIFIICHSTAKLAPSLSGQTLTL